MQSLGLRIHSVSSSNKATLQNRLYVQRYPNYASSFFKKEILSIPSVNINTNKSEASKNEFESFPTSGYLKHVCMRSGALGTAKRTSIVPSLSKSAIEAVVPMKEVVLSGGTPSVQLDISVQPTIDKFLHSMSPQLSIPPVTSFSFSECPEEEIDTSYVSSVHYCFSPIDETEYSFQEVQDPTSLDSSFSCSFNFEFTESFFSFCSPACIIRMYFFPSTDIFFLNGSHRTLSKFKASALA